MLYFRFVACLVGVLGWIVYFDLVRPDAAQLIFGLSVAVLFYWRIAWT